MPASGLRLSGSNIIKTDTAKPLVKSIFIFYISAAFLQSLYSSASWFLQYTLINGFVKSSASLYTKNPPAHLCDSSGFYFRVVGSLIQSEY
jgi:hypothetical protein